MDPTNNQKKKCPKCNTEGYMVIIWKKGVERFLKCYRCGYEEPFSVSYQEKENWQ